MWVVSNLFEFDGSRLSSQLYRFHTIPNSDGNEIRFTLTATLFKHIVLDEAAQGSQKLVYLANPLDKLSAGRVWNFEFVYTINSLLFVG